MIRSRFALSLTAASIPLIAKQRNQHDVRAIAPIGQIWVGLDGLDGARRRNRLPILNKPFDMKRQSFAALAHSRVKCFTNCHATRKIGETDAIAGTFPMDEAYITYNSGYLSLSSPSATRQAAHPSCSESCCFRAFDGKRDTYRFCFRRRACFLLDSPMRRR